VDKASFIPAFEYAANVSVILRPKRWGKSVFLKMISSYYDSANATAPLVRVPTGDTPLAHSFTILKFDVANVARALSSFVAERDVQTRVAAALDAEVRLAVRRAVYRYNIPGIDMTLTTHRSVGASWSMGAVTWRPSVYCGGRVRCCVAYACNQLGFLRHLCTSRASRPAARVLWPLQVLAGCGPVIAGVFDG